MKAKKSYRKGGSMGLPKDISGMGRFGRKLKKLKPIGVRKIMTGEMMQAASDRARRLKDPSLGKTVAEVEKPRRKKRRRKLENGGKVKRTANVNLRGEGKKKEPKKPRRSTKLLPSGPFYGDYINAEKAAAGRLKKMDKIAPKGPDVIGLAQKVKPGTIKKSSAKIPVPAKKKRRLRRK
jgi:hypothetical protein